MAGLMALHFGHFFGFATVVGLKHMGHFSLFLSVTISISHRAHNAFAWVIRQHLPSSGIKRVKNVGKLPLFPLGRILQWRFAFDAVLRHGRVDGTTLRTFLRFCYSCGSKTHVTFLLDVLSVVK